MTSPKMEWDSWEMSRQTKLAKASCFLLQIEGEGRHVYVDTTDVKTQALNIQTLSKFISLAVTVAGRKSYMVAPAVGGSWIVVRFPAS